MLLFNFSLKKIETRKIGKCCICNCIHSLALPSFVFVPEVDKLWPIISSQTSLVQKTEELFLKQLSKTSEPFSNVVGQIRGRGNSEGKGRDC